VKNHNSNLIIFAIVGILFIIVGGFIIKSDSKFKETAIKTTATITDIDTYYDTYNETHYTVSVEFEVDGIKYDGTLREYSVGMHIGGKIDIYYNPLNPNDFISSSDKFLGILFVVMGMISFIFGSRPIFKKL